MSITRFVLEYCDAGNLRKFVSTVTLYENTVLEIFDGVLKGLQHLHDQGLIHGDLKSENILFKVVGNRYVPKLTDYLNTIVEDLTVKSQVTMTPEYAAPEHFSGRATRQSDFWSLDASSSKFSQVVYHSARGQQERLMVRLSTP